MEIRNLNWQNKSYGKVLACLDIDFTTGITVRNWKIINGHSGVFVAPPSMKDFDTGEFSDLIVFDDEAVKDQIYAQVIAAYNDHLGQASSDSAPEATDDDDWG